MAPARGFIVTSRQSEQHQPTTIQNQLMCLVSKMDRLEEMINTSSKTQRETFEMLQRVQRTLGIPSTTISGDDNNNASELPCSIKQMEKVAHHQPQSQNYHHRTLRRRTSSTTSSNTNSSEIEARNPIKLSLPAFPPSGFVNQPRINGNGKRISNPRYIHYINALECLVSSTSISSGSDEDGNGINAKYEKNIKRHQDVEDVWAFLRETVEEGIYMMKSNIPKEKQGLSWGRQDKDQCDEILAYVIHQATHHVPSIPLGCCERNWMARCLMIKRWDNLAEIERRKRRTGRIRHCR
ncbi:hypothetical protein BDA99DRAFT_541604 [Phascolomyces articulosus]|uniref:Uncharacterized protein n=1 Tax=Phascolomyces articulosus TaxID=60185 RepID=A0AAD5K1K9_9FUNG|nr:hypothetical protein BDA99DRAFT_541604 [Phascolomyces articulosus]